jgi:hypothetical protein
LEPDSITSVDLDPDPGGQKLPKKTKSSEISCFELLDVLGLKASSVAWKSFTEA